MMFEQATDRENEGGELLLRTEMDGNEPVTDYDSKTVMMAAERKDNIHIVDIVRKFQDKVEVPNEVSVVKRTDTYYGPELLVHSTVDGTDTNHLINAPGPSSFLHFWTAKTSEDSTRRSGWTLAAEIKATFTAEQPPYEKCNVCGEHIRTIEHERKSILGTCSR